MRLIVAQRLVTISRREAMLRSMRRVALAAAALFPLLSWAAHSWSVAFAGLVATGVLLVLIWSDATQGIEEVTGLRPATQHKLWKRYRTDLSFAMSVRVALSDDGLQRALDEIARSVEQRAAALRRYLDAGIARGPVPREFLHVVIEARDGRGRARRPLLRVVHESQVGAAGGSAAGASRFARRGAAATSGNAVRERAMPRAEQQIRRIARLRQTADRLARRLAAAHPAGPSSFMAPFSEA